MMHYKCGLRILNVSALKPYVWGEQAGVVRRALIKGMSDTMLAVGRGGESMRNIYLPVAVHYFVGCSMSVLRIVH